MSPSRNTVREGGGKEGGVGGGGGGGRSWEEGGKCKNGREEKIDRKEREREKGGVTYRHNSTFDTVSK